MRAAALALAILAPLTSGCIAAAIPLAAGTVMVRSQLEENRAAKAAEAPVMPANLGKAADASARSDFRVVPTALTALPAPDPFTNGGSPAISAFRVYALEQAQLPIGPGKRASAILPSASDLRPQRAECAALPAAVFIDLDPGRDTFDPLAPGDPDRALGTALAELRDQGVKVVWFSRLGTNFADAARAALVASGLDPASRDTMMLLPDLAERKQSLRDAVARSYCPIAILGDERADFDELYLYLRSPDAALALDAMLDKGWFLASPFRPSSPLTVETAPGATP